MAQTTRKGYNFKVVLLGEGKCKVQHSHIYVRVCVCDCHYWFDGLFMQWNYYFHLMVKLFLAGAVGKTSLVLRYVEDTFNPNHVTTLQVITPFASVLFAIRYLKPYNGWNMKILLISLITLASTIACHDVQPMIIVFVHIVWFFLLIRMIVGIFSEQKDQCRRQSGTFVHLGHRLVLFCIFHRFFF